MIPKKKEKVKNKDVSNAGIISNDYRWKNKRWDMRKETFWARDG